MSHRGHINLTDTQISVNPSLRQVMSTRQPYSGSQRKLVLALDIGTTFSGISYSILDPGEVAEITGVTRFPAHDHVGGDSKIPTIIYYDKRGEVRAVGAEAKREGIEADAEDKEWTKAEWQVLFVLAKDCAQLYPWAFKLHLGPQSPSSALIASHPIPPLPEVKTAIDLHQCAQTYIEETYPNGADIWKNLESRTDFVLTHPNGWEGTHQSQMRRAAVKAGLIPNGPAGQQRLSFVTEGEASLHFCIQEGLTTHAMEQGKGIFIVDAGGGTVDITAYKQTSQDTQSFEELVAPECHFQGSVFVTSNARNYLENLLESSRFMDDIPNITECFDKGTKLRFDNDDDAQYIKFGRRADKDPLLNIRSGQLKLPGSDVASFFEPSIQCIVESIEKQRADSKTQIASVFLVGGFAASDWLFVNLKARLSDDTLDICRSDRHVNKAVADGAVSFYLDHFAQESENMPMDPEHIARSAQKIIQVDGRTLISGAFNVILPKDHIFDNERRSSSLRHTKVSEVEEYKDSYCRCVKASIRDFKTRCYRGTKSNPRWVDEDPDVYSTLCLATADTPKLPMRTHFRGNSESVYYQVLYDIILSFGLTELKAQIAWKDSNGIEQSSPAEIVYDPGELICD
ncbi:LOW QUALITY PROTEIN: hypothetical protein CVT25_013908 [Psilocybe cyanescens]|uniref:Uncharacterized protein n=1 Tax=Psilocybe cyanescens TaxID=93625 RepID=A0A409XPL6_PSICY|nr:LOW QUALITY PROTEIN: hypothetical protein CVT25_013908 [Psilocybe cyanescens]